MAISKEAASEGLLDTDAKLLEHLLLRGGGAPEQDLIREAGLSKRTLYRCLARLEDRGLVERIRNGLQKLVIVDQDKLVEAMDLVAAGGNVHTSTMRLPRGFVTMVTSDSLAHSRFLESISMATAKELSRLLIHGEVEGKVYMVVKTGRVDRDVARLVWLVGELEERSRLVDELSPPRPSNPPDPLDRFVWANRDALCFQIAARSMDIGAEDSRTSAALWQLLLGRDIRPMYMDIAARSRCICRPIPLMSIDSYLYKGWSGIDVERLSELLGSLPEDYEFGFEHPYSYDPDLPDRPSIPVVEEIKKMFSIDCETVELLSGLCKKRTVREFVCRRLEEDPNWCNSIPWHFLGFRDHIPVAETWHTAVEAYRRMRRQLKIGVGNHLHLFENVKPAFWGWPYVGYALHYLPGLSSLRFAEADDYPRRIKEIKKRNREYLVYAVRRLFEHDDGFLTYVWSPPPAGEEEQRAKTPQQILAARFPPSERCVGGRWELLRPITIYSRTLMFKLRWSRQPGGPEDWRQRQGYRLRNLEACYRYIFSAVTPEELAKDLKVSEARDELVAKIKRRIKAAADLLSRERERLFQEQLDVEIKETGIDPSRSRVTGRVTGGGGGQGNPRSC